MKPFIIRKISREKGSKEKKKREGEGRGGKEAVTPRASPFCQTPDSGFVLFPGALSPTERLQPPGYSTRRLF